ncbi:TonB-dependent receptor [Niveispirillum sp.]|uniref:TonB-dependent receptor n=1 Tax=Niveispirillum sp. TaxID=1917217 RepID=UPI001B3D2057|nr:TonB-dependent receptor [Niveispirillum sp.]MBP7335979.1 TonB-dependent receptor [Niveispirillum sp.]
MKRLLLSTASLLSLVSLPAFAQADTTRPAQGNLAATVEAGAQGDAGGLVEIIVTAERRATSVQRTPIAISAVDGDALRLSSIADVAGLSQNVPNLNFNRIAGDAKISIRGIGYNSISPGGEPRVALYADGVYQSRNQAALLGFYDVERVEVLRGPQGTLYGRNAIAGTINILTRDPGSMLDGYVTGTAGNYGLVGTEGAVGVPLSDTVQARVSFRTVDRNGYGRNLSSGDDVNDDHSRSIRGKIKFEPSEKLAVKLTGDYTTQNQNAGGYRYAGRGNASIPTFVELIGATVPTNPQDAAGHGPKQRIESYGSSGQADLSLSDETVITLLAGYRHFMASQETSIDGSTAELTQMYIDEHSKSTSAELRLSQKIGDFADLIVGAYYFDETNSASNQVPFKGIILHAPNPDQFLEFYGSFGRVRTKAKAIFGQANIHLTDQLELDVGARYSDEKKTIFEQHQVDIVNPFVLNDPLRPGFNPALGLLGNGEGTQGASWDSFDPKVTLSYQATKSVYLYTTYSRGFKSGGFNVGGLQPPFKPEKLSNYEAGIKADLFDRRLRVNMSAFNYDYKDLQESIIVGTSIVTKNATSARIRGLEAEVTARPVGGLMLSFNGAYLDGKFKTFSDVNSAFANLGLQDLTGKQLPDAPKYQFGGEIGYTFQTDFGDITPRANLTWFDKVYFNHFNTVEMSQPSRTMINLHLGWASPDGNWTASAYVKNLTDDVYFVGTNTNLDALAFSRSAVYGDPLTFGINVTRSF